MILLVELYLKLNSPTVGIIAAAGFMVYDLAYAHYELNFNDLQTLDLPPVDKSRPNIVLMVGHLLDGMGPFQVVKVKNHLPSPALIPFTANKGVVVFQVNIPFLVAAHQCLTACILKAILRCMDLLRCQDFMPATVVCDYLPTMQNG